MSSVERLVTGFETVLGRAVNAHGPRTSRFTVCVSAETKERIAAMGERWQMPASGVAGELLEVLVTEAWEAFTREREGAE